MTKDITYRGYQSTKSNISHKSLEIFGFDTESYDTGECFMYATSEGDVYNKDQFPECLFGRKYRDANFVAYNLGYDEGSIIQFLPLKYMRELWLTGITVYKKMKIKCIPKKCLTISKGGHTVTFYDMLNFYGGSLEYNSQKYLGRGKNELPTKTFSKKYVEDNYKVISEYCVQDCILVRNLARLIIKKFETFGVYPKKLYSTAYVSYSFFRQNCNYVTVNRFWKTDRKLLDYALMSYNGGKFEITKKGIDYLYEYDIVSAYPFEIANLKDISHSRVVWSDTYISEADYGFLNCIIEITTNTFSSVCVKQKNLCVFPIGRYNKVITKREYEYLISQDTSIQIIQAVYLFCDSDIYPYREQIERLVVLKQQFKREMKELDTHTIKIFLNSLYGKFCQIIHSNGQHIASTCWNPIYASIITANTRLRVTELQQKYPSIIAVHTDSVISTESLPFEKTDTLGEFSYQEEGLGLMLGTGIYQIGLKTKFRGFESKSMLMDMIDVDKDVIKTKDLKKYGWREVVFHNWGTEYINRFEIREKELSCHSDRKRLWIDDYQRFDEALSRNVESLPLFVDL